MLVSRMYVSKNPEFLKKYLDQEILANEMARSEQTISGLKAISLKIYSKEKKTALQLRKKNMEIENATVLGKGEKLLRYKNS